MEAVERQQAEKLQQLALQWGVTAHLEQNFRDPEYQQLFAARHTGKILSSLSREWLAEYQAVIADESLRALLESVYPEVLPFLESRLQVVRIAQRLAVQPAPEKKPKKTPEEWLAGIEYYRSRTLTRKRVKVDDLKAGIIQDLQLLQEFIDELQNYAIDDDERERLITEFREHLLGSDEEAATGFQQL